MARRRRRGEEGSVIVLVAVSMLVLIAFTGLVVDGGEITSEVRVSQNAADGAALAAAYELADNSQAISTATTLAGLVAAKNGIPTSDLTLTYLDANRNVTSTPGSVVYVDANVNHSFPTIFLPIINIDSATTHAFSEVKVVYDSGNCVICALDPSSSGALSVNANVNIWTGTTMVNSSSATALTATGNFTDAGGINVAGGYSGTNISPTPTTGVLPIADPLADIPMPTLSLYSSCPVNTVTGGTPGHGQTGWAPGIYNGFSASGNTTYKFDGAANGWCGMRGVFVFTGNVTLTGNASFVVVNGAMIFLTCPTFPISYCGGGILPTGTCAVTGLTGAKLALTGSAQANFAPSPGYGGPYAGMAIFADRCDNGGGGSNYVIDLQGSGTGGAVCSGSVSCLTGTAYTESGNLHIGGNSTWYVSSRIVANDIKFDNTFYDYYFSSLNYSEQPKLLLLV
jgi:Flp pilus assembly protein TadG